MCKERKADALFIAGDLFHRQPLLRELKEVNYLLSGIPDTQVFLIAGNHDYIKKDSYYQTFSWAENVHMIKSGEMTCVEVPKLSLAVYGMSYTSKENRENVYDCQVPRQLQKYEVLLAHGGDEKHIPINKKEIGSLGYDYIALGHIHKHEEIEKNRVYYAGALEPVDKNDVGSHGYVIGELSEEGCTAAFVPAASREYIHMEVPVSRELTGYGLRKLISSKVEEQGMQNIYKITLKGQHDPELVFDLTNMDPFGNIIEIIDNTKPAYDFRKMQEQNSGNLLGKFIKSLYTEDISSIEYLALCEGVQALTETGRG